MCANTVGEFPAVCSRFCFVAEGSKGWPNIRTASLQSCTPAAIPDRWNYRTLKELSYCPLFSYSVAEIVNRNPDHENCHRHEKRS